ncbi:hypothetical protein SLEP1_g52291 [Rubroshorea leprosula]|uniref:F-box associated beta-propeller type 1 domain-containing protein n=1 Tax=Rubroshorea leprosula TaxID=152421 RepID=A0AAV5M6M0_9ROSI|nr:hypothetical protein SLEP1_g52291 [Rubroshorea leprosula]
MDQITDFVNNHLNGSIQSNSNQKLIINTAFAEPTDFYISGLDDDIGGAFLLGNPLRSQRHYTMECGSCNGLFLLGMVVNYKVIDFAIWNPFTRRFKKLLPCPVLTLPGYQNLLGSGLGYDSALDDYQIVMTSKFSNPNSVSFQVWVFSLKSNSWRRSQYVEDALTKCVGLFANGGTLCTPVIHPEHKTVEYYLLVSDKGGEVASGNWRKAFTVGEEEISRCGGCYSIYPPLPFAYSKVGDGILLIKDNGLSWYNLEKKTSGRVEIPGIPKGVVIGKHHVCCESLVSLGNDSAFDGAAEEVMVDDIFPF